ncbi:MAG TPA: glycosyltransferase [Opitutaceae bacterium]|nr:glycosyltransferase [Opitutaceae bacterium]
MNARPRVYFFVRDEPNAYHDDVVVLADGLQQLGCEVFGSANYWRRAVAADDWLVRHDPRVRAGDCDVVAVSYIWPRWIDAAFRVHVQPLPAGLFAPGRRYRTAFLDLDDGYETLSWRPEYRAFDVVFRAKYNRRCEHPANHRPWALGLSARVIAATAGAPPWAARRREALVNFGASHPYLHSARARATPPFIAAARGHFGLDDRRDDLTRSPAEPYDRLMWEQTQRRHSRDYYERLKAAQAVAAFCGELIPAAPHHPPYLVGGGRARLKRHLYDLLAVFDPRPPRLIQWDSWRFWEGLAAGCLVFNLDLPHYGVDLPAMPEPFRHYVPFRPEDATRSFARLERQPGLAERIASEGRAWALEHYSPVALARRFLAALAG